jgi:hypothetical protein
MRNLDKALGRFAAVLAAGAALHTAFSAPDGSLAIRVILVATPFVLVSLAFRSLRDDATTDVPQALATQGASQGHPKPARMPS